MKSIRLALTIFGISFLAFASHAQAQATLTHGPVFGGVSFYDGKVFVRTDRTATVALRYGVQPGLPSFRTSAPVQTFAASDFTATIPLHQLPANTTIYVNVLVNGVPQISGRLPSFKTFDPSTTPKNFKFIYLTDFANQTIVTPEYPSTSFTNAAAETNPSPIFAFIGGDFDHRNPRSLFAKREMMQDMYDPKSLGLSDFVNRILKRMPIVHQWDDHDAGTNNVDKTYPNWNLAYQVYNEYVPSYPTPAAPYGIWHSFRYAQADFFVLDNRSQRDVGSTPDNQNKSMLDGNNLAAATGKVGQLAWLKSGLLNSDARWKIIFSSVVTNPYTKFDDGWAAYQTEWKSLRSYIQSNNIRGVVVVSGDLHIGAIDNGVASGFPEMVVPQANEKPTTRDNCASSVDTGFWSEGIYGYGYSAGGPCAGYGVVTVLTNPDRVLLEVKDSNGRARVSYTVY